MANVTTIRDFVVFQFIDVAGSVSFTSKTKSGIVIAGTDRHAAEQNGTRWGEVICVGEQVQDIKPGQFVLIEPLKWTTRASDRDGVNYWRTEQGYCLAVSDTPVLLE